MKATKSRLPLCQREDMDVSDAKIHTKLPKGRFQRACVAS